MGIDYDNEAALAERNRQDELSRNTQYQRANQAAMAQELDNARRALAGAISTLKAATTDRDLREACRFRYDTAHNRAQAAARRVVSITGKPEPIPAWLAPPTEIESVEMVEVVSLDEKYRETKGLGPTGKGMPARGVPGSASDDWPK